MFIIRGMIFIAGILNRIYLVMRTWCLMPPLALIKAPICWISSYILFSQFPTLFLEHFSDWEPFLDSSLLVLWQWLTHSGQSTCSKSREGAPASLMPTVACNSPYRKSYINWHRWGVLGFVFKVSVSCIWMMLGRFAPCNVGFNFVDRATCSICCFLLEAIGKVHFCLNGRTRSFFRTSYRFWFIALNTFYQLILHFVFSRET